MTTSSTSLLGLALPVTGELNGTWGDVVNNSLTSLLDTAIAGTTTLSSDADVTLTTTTLTTNQARQAVLLCSGARTAVRTITAPAQSKTYVIINSTTGGYGVKIVGAGPTTGVTIPNGKVYLVAWNGSDFVVTGTTTINLTTDVTGTLPVANGGTGLTSFTANGVVYASSSSALATGSVLTFDGTNLGVGATSPSTYGKFVVEGTGSFTSAMVSTSATLTDKPTLEFRKTMNTASGNVNSVGRMSFNGKLNSTAGEQAYLSVSSTNSLGSFDVNEVKLATRSLSAGADTAYLSLTSGGVVQLYGATSTGTLTYNSGGFTSNADTHKFKDALDTTEFVRITSAGNLLVGQTTGSNKLAVTTSGTSLASFTGPEYSQINIIGGTQNFYIQNYNSVSIIGTKGASPLVFTTNEIERARIDSSGNLGVGATTPLTLLHVSGDAAALATLQNTDGSFSLINFMNDGGGTQNLISCGSNATAFVINTNNTERARIDSSGNLLVGTTDPGPSSGQGVKLLPTGRVYSVITSSIADSYDLYNTTAAAYRFYVTNGGTINATSTTITAISDRRLKENIRDLDDGLAAVMSLKPRKFDWKAGKGKDIKDDRGFIAQEFEQVFPDMIDNWKDPAPEGEEPYKAVNANLIPTLVKAIQELKAEFDAYKATHP